MRNPITPNQFIQDGIAHWLFNAATKTKVVARYSVAGKIPEFERMAILRAEEAEATGRCKVSYGEEGAMRIVRLNRVTA